MIKVFLMNPAAKVPTKQTPGSAGFDIYTLETTMIIKEKINRIGTGLGFVIPTGYYGQIYIRSSLAIQGIELIGGVIDSDYRGEIQLIMKYSGHNKNGYIFNKHERIAQIVFHKISDQPQFQILDSNQWKEETTARGTGGFGSTGTT